MNRIVREHYPVSKLPADLREGFEGQTEVRVTIDVAEAGDTLSDRPATPTHSRTLEDLFAMGPPTFDSLEAINAHVRSLRGEEPQQQGSGQRSFLQFRHIRRANFSSGEEVDANIRALRDEWSHREG